MKAREKNLVHVFMPVLVVCLLVLTCTVYAAPPTTQKSTQPAKTVTGTTSPASMKYDPNAAPKGTITIPASSKGNVNASIWVTGSYQYIQWTCNGTYSNRVDVTLWRSNQKIVIIGTGIATGQTAYSVPIEMAAGNYELRITSDGDKRVEARKPIAVKLPIISITAPKNSESLYLGSPYKITWTYEGNPGLVQLSLTGKLSNVFKLWDNLPGSVSTVTMANGQGSAVWQPPSQPFWDPRSAPNGMSYHITIKSKSNIKSTADSAEFGLSCMKNYCVGSVFGETKAVCADLQSDVRNCGSCGNDCEARLGSIRYSAEPLVACVKGKCVCTSISVLCAGKDKYSCVDLKNNQFNCGSCGNECGAWPSRCQNGSCVCLSPNLMCGGKCLDPTTDAKNCGQCGNVCPNNQRYCFGGHCQANDPNTPADPSATIPKYWGR
jgi:hypothetical protein